MELPSIFIGRSLSAATRRWLKKQPIRFIEHPFIRIQFRKPKVEFLQSIKDEKVSLVVTSSYAAHWLVRFRRHFGLRSKHEIYCLSEKQRDILRKARMKVHLAAEPNTLSLAQLIAENNNGQRVVYLRGDKALNDLYERLFVQGIPAHEMEVYKNTPIETWINEAFDAYLFFSPTAIENYKASGNFPAPKAQIMAVGENTAMTAWKVFPNSVNVSPDQEELSFVKYSVDRIIKKMNQPESKRKIIY
ncbi:uroporphyrinogen-III synthase [Gaoshiqia sp. Z1-71]|uniref:uroporphyrinogen-III synthase n=1 Tax=Gaoshiqia hydrogeniformans TaxID=3290090 RepID=UPI003BF82796